MCVTTWEEGHQSFKTSVLWRQYP